jgi:hypothetical protein
VERATQRGEQALSTSANSIQVGSSFAAPS